MSNVLIKCPDCGTYVKGKTGLFSSSFSCTNCGRKISPKKDAGIVVCCPECGNNVMFDTTSPDTQECPVCHASLASFMIKEVEVECPKCHMHVMVRNNETFHTCPICDEVFNVAKAKEQKESRTGAPSVVMPPKDNDLIIWVHPEKSFPYASVVIVPEGYTALILRNGICSHPSAPGKYLLSDSLKSVDEQLKDAVFDENQQVAVKVIFVKNIIDGTFRWNSGKVEVPDELGLPAGTLAFAGTVQLKVTDARKLAESIGYRNASADVLDEAGQMLSNKVGKECIDAAYRVLRSEVSRGGMSYQALTMDCQMYAKDIQRLVDESLADIGLRTSFFTLEHVTFVEGSSADIIAYAEKPIDWESQYIRVSRDPAVYADLKFGGTIKFLMSDRKKFFNRSEIKEWLKKEDGVSEFVVQDYFSSLASDKANDVLNTLVRNEFNGSRGDIRDLSSLYSAIKGSIYGMLQQSFGEYGLTLEHLTLSEKDRKESAALQKETDLFKHKAFETIEIEKYSFDSDIEVKKHGIDVDKDLRKDDIDVEAEGHYTDSKAKRTEHIIRGMRLDHAVKEAEEQLERDDKLKHDAWKDEDALSDHLRTVKEYKYTGEEKKALHYLDMQIILDQAEELRTEWEEQSRLEFAQLQQMLKEREIRDDASDSRMIKSKDLEHRLAQSDTENDRVINSILRKIAESDLDLQAKKDEYDRILSSKLEEDKLRLFAAKSEAETKAAYDSGHTKILLTEEENRVLEEARQREADRLEKIKDAEFMRSLKQQELTVRYEMEKLKMQYDAEIAAKEAEAEIGARQFEIDKLTMMLEHYEKLDETDLLRVQTESKYKAEIAKYESEAAGKKEIARLEMEEKFSERADELLTKMLAIQEAMKKLEFENERVHITESAGVAKAYAEAGALKSSDFEKLLRELEKIAKAVSKGGGKGGSGKDKSGKSKDKPADPDKNKYPGKAPSVRRCPHCDQELPPYATTSCPFCYTLLTK